MSIVKDFELVKIILTNYRPFNKPRIKKVTITYKDKVNVITSTNGCGKSLFLRENNVNLINTDNFYPSGGKVAYCTGGGNAFRIESTHKLNSFKIKSEDGTWRELNGGNTKTSFKALVLEWLGIDEYTWNISTGVLPFTAASKQERRVWLETISQQDFSYGFKVYKRITQAVSDYRGAIKLSSKELVSLSDKVRSSDEIDALTTRCAQAQEVMERMLTLQQSTPKGNYQQSADKLKVKINEAWERVKVIKTKVRDYPMECFEQETLEALAAEIRGQMAAIDGHLAAITKINEDIYDRDKFKRELGEVVNKEEVLIKKQELEDTLLVLRDKRPPIPDYCHSVVKDTLPDLGIDQVAKLIGTLSGFGRDFYQLTNGLEDDYYTLPHNKEEQERLITSYNNNVATCNTLHNEQSTATDLIERLGNADKLACRKCGHVQPALNVGETEDELVRRRDSAGCRLYKLKEKQLILSKELSAFKSIQGRRIDLRDKIPTGDFIHEPLSLIIKENINSIGGMLNEINTYTAYLEWVHSCLALDKQLNEQDGILYILDLANSPSRKDFFVPGNLENKLIENRAAATSLKEANQKLKAYGNLKKEQHALLTTLLSDLQEYIRLRNLEVNLNSDIILSELLGKLRQDTLEKNTILTSAKNAQLQKDVLESKIEEYQITLEHLKILDKAMNPTTGIIADQLIGYTVQFAEQLTELVNNVWAIDLTIRPCTVADNKGLTYQFPWQVTGDNTSLMSDISAASTAELAIFNLAVLLATRAALEVEHLPLCLDEPGQGFDGTHKKQLVDYLITLVNTYPSKLIFIIHHDISIRHRLPPHSTIVFDDRNVVLPPEYNEHTEIERH